MKHSGRRAKTTRVLSRSKKVRLMNKESCLFAKDDLVSTCARAFGSFAFA
jgi:hypothetical protein